MCNSYGKACKKKESKVIQNRCSYILRSLEGNGDSDYSSERGHGEFEREGQEPFRRSSGAFRGPAEWSKEDTTDEWTVFSTSADPIHAGDKAYLLLKIHHERPLINWMTYDQSRNKLAEGAIVPFML